ncbi:MAG: TetR/AcrR family transcriptional regulator [Pseudomonadota bacterium]
MSEGTPIAKRRGRDSVKAALIQATKELLGDEGPSRLSVRQVAARAGVNHGQVQHYFGGKSGLVRATMHELAREHFESATAPAGDDNLPKPLALNGDLEYLRAVVRLVMDDALDIATLDIDEGLSVARYYLTLMFDVESVNELPLAAKVPVMTCMAMELGWAAMEPFLMMQTGIAEEDRDLARAHARNIARAFAREVLRPQKIPATV